MKLSGESPEVAAWRASAANLGLSMARIATAIATGNLGFMADAIHDAGDAVSFGAKAIAIEKDHNTRRSHRLRLGAVALMGGSGAFELASGVYTYITDHAEHANTSTIAIAAATTGVSAVIARVTHRAKRNYSEHHSATKDVHLHAITDTAGSAIYTLALAAQAATGNPNLGAGGLGLAGIVTLAGAAHTFHSITHEHAHDH